MEKRRAHSAVNLLGLGILWLFAAACAALPVFVHLHPDRFGPPTMTFYGTPESGIEPTEAAQARSTVAILRPKLQLDQITTGSIERTVRPTRPRVLRMQSQPFPDGPNPQSAPIQFISATSNRALAVIDGRWVILVPGDRLPDGRLIERFEQTKGAINPIATPPAVLREPSPFPGR